MIVIRQKGDFSKASNYLKNLSKPIDKQILHRYGKKGLAALESATPRDTGKTAESWSYGISEADGRYSIIFSNSNIKKGYWGGHEGVPIAIVIQYGHATRNGGWVEGIDYINPALRDVFKEFADSLWEEVKKL